MKLWSQREEQPCALEESGETAVRFETWAPGSRTGKSNNLNKERGIEESVHGWVRPIWLERTCQGGAWKSAWGFSADVVARRNSPEGFRQDSYYFSSFSQWTRWLSLVRVPLWVMNFWEGDRWKWWWQHQACLSGSQMVINLGQEASLFPRVLWLHSSCRK